VSYVLGLAKNKRLVKIMGRSDPEELETSQTGGSQSRTPGQGSPPTVRGNVAISRTILHAGTVRRTLLCAWGDGESHQGTATGAVCRSYFYSCEENNKDCRNGHIKGVQ
jgi:hypothetical protein